jgi:outer membrane protein assembly factor BamE (lipoprotein component of BamABCDE complex)
MKKLILTGLLFMLNACCIVHRAPIQQGNIITQSALSQLVWDAVVCALYFP